MQPGNEPAGVHVVNRRGLCMIDSRQTNSQERRSDGRSDVNWWRTGVQCCSSTGWLWESRRLAAINTVL